MKKYIFLTAIGMSLFLNSCSTDDLESNPNKLNMEEIAKIKGDGFNLI